MIKHREYLLVTIREGARDFTVSSPEDDFPAQLSYDRQIDDEESGFYGEWEQTDIDLPPGSWQLIGLASELTHEQMIMIFDFTKENLFKSHNLNPDTTIVLKQIQP